jgi:hypothetical protein
MQLYLYVPRGYTPGYLYHDFGNAVKQLLKDERSDSLDALAQELDESDWWYEFTDDTVSIDDGARIERIEVKD